MSNIQTLYDLAMSEKWNLYAGTVILFISSMITMIYPFGVGQIIDKINNANKNRSETLERLYEICIMVLVIYGIQCVCTFLRYYLLELANDRIKQRIKMRLLSSILEQEITFFDKNQTGELINRLSDDTSVLSYCVTKNLANGLRSIFIAVVGLFMMFTVSARLSYIALWTVPPLAIMTITIGYYLRNVRKEVQTRLGQSMQVAQERIANIKTVRSFCKEKSETEAFRESCDHVLKIKEFESLIHSLFHSGIEFSNGIMVATIVYFGGGMLNNNSISPGTLATFLLSAQYVANALKELSGFYTQLMTGMGAAARVQQIIHRTPSIEVKGGEIPKTIEGHIRFHSVSFSYPSRPDSKAINEVNLDLEAGKVFAIFGASGSGKSTLGALLLRFYDPEGVIKLDGQDIKNLDPQWLRQQIGYVSQDPVLFSGSIKDNILYGYVASGEASTSSGVDVDQLIYKIAKDVNALEFILRFPQKFETLVGERGVMLSGGQRQRIAIARALIKNPKILLFDEATSALDAESESLIQEALERVGQNRTVIIIAHRLSTIKNADKIAVISDGMLAEVGTFKDLMAIPYGKFKKLAERQTLID